MPIERNELHHDCTGFEDCATCAWRARAEALAGVLRSVRSHWPDVLPADAPLDRTHPRVLTVAEIRCIDAALARLPAQALAERRALEECAEYIRDHHECPDCDSGCMGCRYIAALDAARGEGGA